ncbi:hypothetical protein B0J15DRAFT_468312 [Fusarium solani]|uniref:Uncharacterized protein n=1 Tax=Fusarium solani TaxID=169388 RepID=A0A9P9H1S2_FUSSL|nr:uncharacterized protein B0J15DRAFT_468312 [Fusarium solani]KAH7248302.1 hypothetical protein B0J15DRAFT_468312 [Fusarium solani]
MLGLSKSLSQFPGFLRFHNTQTSSYKGFKRLSNKKDNTSLEVVDEYSSTTGIRETPSQQGNLEPRDPDIPEKRGHKRKRSWPSRESLTRRSKKRPRPGLQECPISDIANASESEASCPSAEISSAQLDILRFDIKLKELLVRITKLEEEIATIQSLNAENFSAKIKEHGCCCSEDPNLDKPSGNGGIGQNLRGPQKKEKERTSKKRKRQSVEA